MTALEVFWSFRSPYSYLAVDRLCAIRDRFDIEVKFRPVRPLAMREPDFFERGRKQFVPYLLQDFPREARRLGLAYGLPNPDPIEMDMSTGKVAPKQPLMERVMALGIAACAKDKGLDFARAVSARVWTGKPWSDDASLSAAAKEAGSDLSALESWARDNAAAVSDAIASNEADQLVHHWGVPLMVVENEAFFGQDRLDTLVWRLDEMGLRRVDGD